VTIYSVDDMCVDLDTVDGGRRVIHGVSFSIEEGEVLALVGESGCGKSLIAMGGLDLHGPGASTTSGTVHFDGNDLGMLTDDAWRRVVGGGIGLILQDPIGAHDPLQAIGPQSGEVLAEHFHYTDEEIRRRVADAFGEVRLPLGGGDHSYAHQLSRGEAQRAMVAAAILTKPKLLIADEPLAGLDVTVARAVLDIIESLRRRHDMAMLLVTHDLAVVAGVADRVAIVYAGSIVEQGPVTEIFHHPRHPYTSGLLGSIPSMTGGLLRPIEGSAPDITSLPPGCAFAARCEYATAECRSARPEAVEIGSTAVSCLRAAELTLQGVRAG